jgi:hypothetical protein
MNASSEAGPHSNMGTDEGERQRDKKKGEENRKEKRSEEMGYLAPTTTVTTYSSLTICRDKAIESSQESTGEIRRNNRKRTVEGCDFP